MYEVKNPALSRALGLVLKLKSLAICVIGSAQWQVPGKNPYPRPIIHHNLPNKEDRDSHAAKWLGNSVLAVGFRLGTDVIRFKQTQLYFVQT